MMLFTMYSTLEAQIFNNK